MRAPRPVIGRRIASTDGYPETAYDLGELEIRLHSLHTRHARPPGLRRSLAVRERILDEGSRLLPISKAIADELGIGYTAGEPWRRRRIASGVSTASPSRRRRSAPPLEPAGSVGALTDGDWTALADLLDDGATLAELAELAGLPRSAVRHGLGIAS